MQTGSGRKPAPLAPERRRRLPHLVEKRSKDCGNLEVRRQDDRPGERPLVEIEPRRFDEVTGGFATTGDSMKRLGAPGEEYAADSVSTREAEKAQETRQSRRPSRQPEAACWEGRRKPTTTAVMSDGRRMLGLCPTSGPTT